MKITQVPCDWAPYTNEEKGRTDGLHLSDLVSMMMNEQDPDKFAIQSREDFDQGTWGRMELGSAWELYDRAKMIARGAQIVHGHEYEQDGIKLTPDGLIIGERVLEWKLTWASSSRDLVEWHWYWLPQIKSYCYVCGVVDATLRVANACGDWKPPVPSIRQFDFTFSMRELKENWQKVLNYKKLKLKRERIADRKRTTTKGSQNDE